MLKDKLIQAGIKQMTVKGVEHFSLREAAKECGVSCAAPFKHFKDRAEYFQAISDYLDQQLSRQVLRIEEEYAGNAWMIYQESSYAYIEYLISRPFLMNLSFWSDISSSRKMGIRRWKSFERVLHNFSAYCRTLSLGNEEYRRAFFAMQNLTYGVAFMATAKMLDPSQDYSVKLRDAMEDIFREYRSKKE